MSKTPASPPVNALRQMIEGGPPPACSKTLGFRDARLEDDTVIMEYEPGEHLLNPIGTVQGGIVAAILDDVFSVALLARLGPDHVAPTIEMKVSYLKPVKPGRVRGIGRLLQRGGSIAFAESELRDMEGTLLAKASATIAVRKMAV